MKNNSTRRSLNDVPMHEIVEMMTAYTKRYSRTVRTSRAYLRSVGMDIDHKGIWHVELTEVRSAHGPKSGSIQ